VDFGRRWCGTHASRWVNFTRLEWSFARAGIGLNFAVPLWVFGRMVPFPDFFSPRCTVFSNGVYAHCFGAPPAQTHCVCLSFPFFFLTHLFYFATNVVKLAHFPFQRAACECRLRGLGSPDATATALEFGVLMVCLSFLFTFFISFHSLILVQMSLASQRKNRPTVSNYHFKYTAIYSYSSNCGIK
jgi:hypothetical protein